MAAYAPPRRCHRPSICLSAELVSDHPSIVTFRLWTDLTAQRDLRSPEPSKSTHPMPRNSVMPSRCGCRKRWTDSESGACASVTMASGRKFILALHWDPCPCIVYGALDSLVSNANGSDHWPVQLHTKLEWVSVPSWDFTAPSLRLEAQPRGKCARLRLEKYCSSQAQNRLCLERKASSCYLFG